MSLMLIAATALAAPTVETCPEAAHAAATISEQATTGTLLFSKGDCLAVRIYSKSCYTHVAAIVIEDDKPFVYDSMNGVGVRRLPLVDYLARQAPDVMHVLQPAAELEGTERRQFVEHLRSELGRPYGIRHHVTGKRARGVHCAEYMTDALMACELIHAQRPARVSPASLREGLLKTDLYTHAQSVEIRPPAEPLPTADGWCDRMWIDTKVCTKKWCVQMGRWFLCK